MPRGDATSRMQMAYQAEQSRQQLQAQVGTVDALRKLREQVNETEKSMDSTGPRVIGEETESGAEGFSGNETPSQGDEGKPGRDGQDGAEGMGGRPRTHIDIRV